MAARRWTQEQRLAQAIRVLIEETQAAVERHDRTMVDSGGERLDDVDAQEESSPGVTTMPSRMDAS